MHQKWVVIAAEENAVVGIAIPLIREIQANEILKDRHRLNEILARHTGRPIDVIEKETERDRYFSSQEAKEFGLVDEVLEKKPEEKKVV